ncbi:hypothetical protein GQ600_23818 [Phytophthora cactorum]|nr:hypothetical protein GQ600_23818 [Phytophthora cactorum]
MEPPTPVQEDDLPRAAPRNAAVYCLLSRLNRFLRVVETVAARLLSIERASQPLVGDAKRVSGHQETANAGGASTRYTNLSPLDDGSTASSDDEDDNFTALPPAKDGVESGGLVLANNRIWLPKRVYFWTERASVCRTRKCCIGHRF